ncbi:hypothetical protein ACEWY4_020692 [Coilia grayii]|uniref:Tumor necrosis factor receptor superfamily member 6 n=1 Tax=Coilia grayii TaxID=363190 RepID=A0ABD1J772_9TELE
MKRHTGMICVLVVVVLVPFTHGHPRRRRQGDCEYGIYSHEGNTCCKCPRGFYVESHCTASVRHSTCKQCARGTKYTADANSQDHCDVCSVCNAKANLEVVSACISTADTVCGCRDGHFCEEDNCKACHECARCEFGEKVPCSKRNNTVCNGPPEEGNSTGVVLGIIVVIVAVIAAVIAAVILLRWRKMLCFGKQKKDLAEDPKEEEPLQGIDLMPHVSEIVDKLSWSDMAKVAGRTGMTHVQIHRHRNNHPHDEGEQLTNLLLAWIEYQGLDKASGTLIQTLRKCKLKQKADEIQRILRQSTPAAES